ncbi:hypothetical protein BTM25_14060 [Actinomadura rubteroloni]|uniref:Protein-glutamine gamma-glutamyltransferase-like C-terminal domain-containing protein n=1 Tax=Actinomadura rubteroloni TaxID=1926885 RepID=A0A2P4UPL7_9ACTN|nr:DUF4129 domain-containing protein [Actinomadura rubteroloni]POM26998.1 hypothetical protein BTM25_14060 [Actinomadura rubteroloni]
MIVLDPIGREQARELARRELEKPIYHRDEPSWTERTWRRFSEWLNELLHRASDPGGQQHGNGWLSLLVILLIVGLVIALVAWLMRGRRNPADRPGLFAGEPEATALDLRVTAERHAAAGRWPEAIRSRLLAVARDLEERAVVEPRPGRTADELAREAGAALPGLAAELRAAVRVFDDVWYGDRPGGPDGYALLTALDEHVRATRPQRLEPVGADEGARW